MLISHSHKFIYVHIPKTGGTSLTETLRAVAKEHFLPLRIVGNFLDNRGFERGVVSARIFGLPRHSTAGLMKEFHGEVFENYFKFAIVRNPWDLVVSEYFYIRRRPRHYLHKKVTQMHSVREFLELKLDPRSHPRNRLEQSDFISVDGEIAVDYVGRFEDINESIDHILKTIDVKATLGHQNKTKRGRYQDYFDDESIELVRKIYKSDISNFGYEFETSV